MREMQRRCGVKGRWSGDEHEDTGGKKETPQKVGSCNLQMKLRNKAPLTLCVHPLRLKLTMIAVSLLNN